MQNLYDVTQAKILKIKKEGSNSVLFTLKLSKGSLDFECGQFVQVSVPGFGEAPISICSNPQEKDNFQICAREVGRVTSKMHALKVGDKVGIRGPYGNGFPVKKGKEKNLVLVVGGLGLEPVRPAILEFCKNSKNFKDLQVFYGACSEDDLLFCSDYKNWKKKFDFRITLDQPQKDKSFKEYGCSLGMVTALMDKYKILEDSVVFLCGPPVMYKFVIKKLKEKGFKDEDIYISLERRMHCAVGVCQHCAIGSKYVCKDGPVFNWAQIKDIKGSV